MKHTLLRNITFIVALFLFAGCENDKNSEQNSTSFDSLVEYGKYIGMSSSDVTNDLTKNGWSTCDPEEEWEAPVRQINNSIDDIITRTGYSFKKKIDGVNMYLTAEIRDGKCVVLGAGSIGVPNATSVVQNWYNKIGESYYFPNIDNTAKFSFLGNENKGIATNSYEEGKNFFNSSEINAQWWCESGFNGGVEIFGETEEGEINICFGEL